MEWFNKAPQCVEQGNTITITSAGKTDFWRKTHYGFTRDNGHFYYQPVTGDFVAEVKFSGQYRDLYDQAGLMVRLDEQTWIKCGIEYVNGVQQASAVITREFSDWSVLPLNVNPKTFWLRLTRKKEAVEVHWSLDGKDYHLLRMGYLTTVEAVHVGLVIASPDGTGFTTVFEDFSVRPI